MGMSRASASAFLWMQNVVTPSRSSAHVFARANLLNGCLQCTSALVKLLSTPGIDSLHLTNVLAAEPIVPLPHFGKPIQVLRKQRTLVSKFPDEVRALGRLSISDPCPQEGIESQHPRCLVLAGQGVVGEPLMILRIEFH
jgi:hypothetical protein